MWLTLSCSNRKNTGSTLLLQISFFVPLCNIYILKKSFISSTDYEENCWKLMNFQKRISCHLILCRLQYLSIPGFISHRAILLKMSNIHHNIFHSIICKKSWSTSYPYIFHVHRVLKCYLHKASLIPLNGWSKGLFGSFCYSPKGTQGVKHRLYVDGHCQIYIFSPFRWQGQWLQDFGEVLLRQGWDKRTHVNNRNTTLC